MDRRRIKRELRKRRLARGVSRREAHEWFWWMNGLPGETC